MGGTRSPPRPRGPRRQRVFRERKGCLLKIRVVGPGHLLFAAGLAGLGVLSLGSGDFALNWQPVPAWVPWREILARASGLLLLACGIGMLLKRTAIRCALVMAAYMLSWVVVLQCPRAAAAPGDLGVWLGVSESVVLMTGGWMVFASLAGPREKSRLRFVTGDRGARLARLLFGLACLVLGLSHFVYAETTAGMVPAWLPSRFFFAYLTGAGHLAAGLGVLSGVLPRLAATMEAGMISLFVLLVHIPGVVSAPGSRLQWTMLFVASALAGAVWAIARSLQDASWGWARAARIATRATPA